MVLAPYYEIVESWAGLQAAIKVPLRKLNDDMHIYLLLLHTADYCCCCFAVRHDSGFLSLKVVPHNKERSSKKYQKIDHGMEK